MSKLIGGSRFALPGLLLVSLTINGVLLLRARASASERSPRKTRAGLSEKRVAASAYSADLLQCRRQLRVHQLRTAQRTRARLSGLFSPPAQTQTDDPKPMEAADYAAQQQMLCTLGLQELRKNWEHGRDQVHDNLLRDLRNRGAQARDLKRTLDTYSDTLDLSNRQRSSLEKSYLPLRDRRVSAALSALEADPPDYLAAFDEAQDLYSDTDQLVRQLHGKQAVDQVRGADLKRRTLVLAVLASLADVDWDRSIEW